MRVRLPPRPVATTLSALAALLLVSLTLLLLPLSPFALIGTVATHVLHVAAAFAAGLAILRIPRAAPKEALDLVVTAVALGFGFLSLLALAVATLGFAHPLAPWIVDAAGLLIGLKFLRAATERIVASWRKLDLSIVVASRIPLHATLCALALPLVVTPLAPATPATGAGQLALPAQVVLRHDLTEAVAASPGAWPTPSMGLLLHGHLAAGPAGARLFPLALVGLLVAGAVLHASRHLGLRSPEWVAACLVGSPALFLLVADDPSGTFLVTYAFLAFHEVADWCQRATGGKIALASIYGGLAAAESPRGVALFGAALAFLFVVQAVLDRNGIFRQVPGLAGMVLVAALAAAPFLCLAAAAQPGTLTAALAERHRAGAPAASAVPAPEAPAEAMPPGPVAGGIPRSLLAIGPLVVGLLLFLPVVPHPPEGLGHVLLFTILSGACWFLPAPYGTGLGLLPPLAACAGGAAAGVPGGISGRLTGAFMLVAAPTTLVLTLTLGPDVLAAASVLVGRTPAEAYAAATVPDHELARAVAARAAEATRPVLLVGTLTDCHYPVVTTRVVPGASEGRDGVADALRRDKTRVSFIAVDRETTPDDCPVPFDRLALVGSYGPGGRFMLYRAEPFQRR